MQNIKIRNEYQIWAHEHKAKYKKYCLRNCIKYTKDLDGKVMETLLDVEQKPEKNKD